MKIIIQRAIQGSVSVDGKVIGEIRQGYVLLVGMKAGDTEDVVATMAEKVANVRIMADEEGKMNRSILDAGGSVLAISQFTLYADTKGRRPGFTEAARPEIAEPLFIEFVGALKAQGINVEMGKFGADMKVSLVNDGPVTIILEN